MSREPEQQKLEDEVSQLEEAYARAQLRARRAKPVAPLPANIGTMLSKQYKRMNGPKVTSLKSLQARWSDIAGDKLSKVCWPENLTTSKSGQVLTLRVVPGAAVIIQHQIEMLRQRTSVAVGGDLTKVKLVQGALPGAGGSKNRPRTPLTPDQRHDLVQGLAMVENTVLKNALLALGTAVLEDGKS